MPVALRCMLYACGVDVWDGGESDSDDLFSCPHHSLQILMVQSGAVSESGSDAATQEALYSPSVESGENGRWAFLSLLRKWRCFWAFFTEEPVFRHQVMFSARWTPRDFVFFTVSTGEPWMFSGSWSLCALRKSTTISLVLSIFRDRLLTLHQVISCSTSSLYDDSLLVNENHYGWTAVDWAPSLEVPLCLEWWCWSYYFRSGLSENPGSSCRGMCSGPTSSAS